MNPYNLTDAQTARLMEIKARPGRKQKRDADDKHLRDDVKHALTTGRLSRNACFTRAWSHEHGK